MASLKSGAERAFLELSTYLHRNGVKLTAAVPAEGDLRDALNDRGISVAVVGYGWSVRGREGETLDKLDKLEAFMASMRPDVVLTNTSVIPWFAQIAASLGVPHGWILAEDVTTIGLDYLPDQATALAQIDELSDAIFVPARWLRDRYAELLWRDDIVVAPPAFDRALLGQAKPPSLTSTQPLRVITYGAIYPGKNQLEALRALDTAVTHGVDVTLTVMGHAANRAYDQTLRAYVEDRALSANVSFLPHHADPVPTVADHDVVLVASVIESFGRTMVEGMLLGKAVVAATSPAAIERLGADGRYGFLYQAGQPDDLARTLASLAGDRRRLAAVAHAGHEAAVAEFQERDTRRPLLDALTRIAGAPKRTPLSVVAPVQPISFA